MKRRKSDSLIGMLILDQYYLVKLLGKGGMSEVYLAEQSSMERYAAVKILRARRAISEEAARRFRQEARAISRLSHQHIVTVYNFGELADGSLFLAMEYVDGASLDKFIYTEGPVPAIRAINMVFQCAAGLGYAHSRKIVHRDFKPENVMIARQLGRDHLKVLDFGIARLLDDSYASQPGSIVGTPQYLSPEQCRGEQASPFSDQYSLGLVFYELVTGKPAVVADRLINFLHKHQYATPRPPSEVLPGRPVQLVEPIIMRMLAKNPRERFASMEELQNNLEAVATALLHEQTAPTVDRPPPASALSEAVSRPAVLAPGVGVEQMQPAAVLLLESAHVLEGRDWDHLRADGFLIVDQREQIAGGDLRPDLFLLGTSAVRWRAAHKQWSQVHPPQKMLTCIEASVDPLDVAEAIKRCSHVMIGPHPLEPTVVTAALRWMQGRCHGVIESLASKQTVQLLQIASSALKSHYVESLADDLRANGVRRPVLRALRELVEEMVMNALYHAPRGSAGWKSLQRDPGQPVTLRPGQEAILRWSIGDQFVVVSVRDPFGSATATDIFSALAGPPGQRAQKDGRGGGLGLRIMLRAASHLMILISPGRSTEVVALIEVEPAGVRRERRSLCVLQGWDREIQQIGDNLWLHEASDTDSQQLRLRGDVNENCELSQVFDREGTVHLDLSGVATINSRGIHTWIQASRQGNPGLRLLLERCSPAIVSQLSLLPALVQSGTVVSIIAPYFCAYCRKESFETLQWQELLTGPYPPTRYCLVCSSSLEFDEIVEEYFAFVADLQQTGGEDDGPGIP